MAKMAKIIIDGKTYEVDASRNLLEAILSLKLNLQYFCWHPAMGSVGACRQCAIKKFRDENDTKGKLFMACMEPIVDGMRVSIEDPEAKEFRAGVIEWLMTNHPHDCPVCDEGGECHLQDMTLMSGHNYRRFRFKKRTYRNQYLGPFVHHEMNRCIQCYRCVRFYRDYAGGNDLNVFGVHSSVYFGRSEDGVLENEFAGNLVEVCPTGVFTDNTLYQHYTRKWDLTSSPSICVHCGVGCNTLAGERYGKLRRILTRYNGQVNGYFLCDRGRFGYEFVNSEKRIRKPLLRVMGENRLAEADEEAAITEVSSIIKSSKKIMGIGSPRASLEANFTLRSLVSERNFYWGVPDVEFSLLTKEMNILRQGSIRTPSLREIEKCDVVVILGEDLTNTAPMIALAVRQSVRQIPVQSATPFRIPHWQDASVRELVQDEKGPVFVATPYATKLDEVAHTYRGTADDIARLGYAVAGLVNSDAPKVNDLTDEVLNLSQTIVNALNKAERPLIIAGQSLKSEAIINAASNIAYAMRRAGKNVELCFTVPECNSMGMVMMGGKALDQAFQAVEKEAMDTLIIMENDLYRRDEKENIDRFLKRFKNVIVLDYLENPTAEHATAVIPVGSFAESDGTFVNNEGRAQRFYQVFVPNKEIKESWRWLRNIMVTSGLKEFSKWKNLLDYTQALIKEMPFFTGIDTITPPPGFRIAGRKIPREPYRYSGRTAMHADKNVHEPKPPEDVDSPMSFTMEGYRGQPPSSLIPFFWSPGWNSAQAINKYQIEVGGPLHGGDPGKRLIEPLPNAKPSFFMDVPKAPVRKDGEWTLVPVYHIYGSEELSNHAPGVRELVPKPYLMMSLEDASAMNVTSDSEVEVSLGGKQERFAVKINLGLPKGMAGYPVALPGMRTIRFPVSVKISGVKK
ncbi:MAG TPA: NADH-quinone oxidoreductase subunit NuoG [Ignavibacteriales bacterium]|nr:NADH-quinone oxidoreductase subunit NuoG [Ignavibacteriales bacterium]